MRQYPLEFSIKIHRAYKDGLSGAPLRTDLMLKLWTSCFLSREMNVNNCDQFSVSGQGVPVF